MASGVRKTGSGEHGREAALCAAVRDEASRASLYDEVTETIIAQLEAGVYPWVQPWSTVAAGVGLPRNAISGRPYSGINVLIPWGVVIEGGYPSQDPLTFRQALAVGGFVRKGERGRTVFYADCFSPKKDKTQRHEQGDGENEASRSFPFLKRFTVFNFAQCDGLPERFFAAPISLSEPELHQAAEALIAASGADFGIGGGEAFYVPALDFVQVPPQPAFTHQIDYYRTAPHEFGH